MISRRAFLRFLASVLAVGASTTAYGVVIEPWWRLRVTTYRLTPPAWPKDFRLRLAVVADIHACEPWMDASRVRKIVDLTNTLDADAILLLGDYIATHRYQTPVPPADWARALAALKAPLGVHAVLGNHDWWSDMKAVRALHGPTWVRRALEDAGLKVYENDAVRLEKDGKPFWLLGLGDQIALIPVRGWRHPQHGVDDLAATLAKITDDAPAILMAHEPDVFPTVPARVALTVSGHMHGGQIRLFGRPMVAPSRYGRRYAYGHVREDNRDIIISGGLGCSGAPVRIGSPPEVVLIELGGEAVS